MDLFINGDSLFIKELLNQSLDVTETINLSTNIFLHSLRTLKIHIFPTNKMLDVLGTDTKQSSRKIARPAFELIATRPVSMVPGLLVLKPGDKSGCGKSGGESGQSELFK